jgi:hypothetical protein
MKKILLSALCAGFLVSGYSQQVEPAKTAQLQFYQFEVEDQVERPVQSVNRGGAIWTEDFANGFNSTNGTWTQGGTDQIWKHSFFTTSGEWSTGTPQFLGTTAPNGFMLFDADSVNFLVSPNYVDRDGELISPSIDLSSEASVLLEFEHNFRYCCNTGVGLLNAGVSNDGGISWTEYDVVNGVAVNAASANPEIASIDISAVAANQANVMLRFRWGAAGESHYYWIVDDINLVSGAPAPPVATSFGTDAICNGVCDGTATATVTGGVPPFTYFWTPTSQTTSTITGLCAGSYTCLVTDSNFDTTSTVVVINEPAAIALSMSSTISSGSDGTATAVASGGTPPYTYLWDDPGAQTTATATGLAPGVYNVIVTDANGCISTSLVTVSSSVGIADNSELFENLIVSPNPSADIFNVRFNQLLDGKTSIKVVNMIGEVVEIIQLDEMSGAKSVNIAVAEWPAGVYFLQLVHGKNPSNGVRLLKY